MSLRLRLTPILGSAFIPLWSLAAAWMLCDLRGQMMRSFDQRLAASARMVAGLLQQLPQPQPADGQTTRLSAEQLGIPNGMACQVSSLRGEVPAQSHATPGAGAGQHRQRLPRPGNQRRAVAQLHRAGRRSAGQHRRPPGRARRAATLGGGGRRGAGDGRPARQPGPALARRRPGSGAAQADSRRPHPTWRRLAGATGAGGPAERTEAAGGNPEPVVPAHRPGHRTRATPDRRCRPRAAQPADRDQDPPAGRAHDRGAAAEQAPGPRRGRRRPSAPDAGPAVAAGAGGRQPVVRRRRQCSAEDAAR